MIAFEGQTDPDWLIEFPHDWVKLGAVARTLKLLHEAKADDICMIGPVGRPSLTSLALDWRALKMLPRLGGGLDAGDDKLLRVIVAELESEGFRVVGADDVSSDLLSPPGQWGRHKPTEQDQKDIDRAIAVLQALGPLDIGQSIVVQQGMVLAVEAIEGTDRMIERAGQWRRQAPGGVLVKGRKSAQDRRADLPTIGSGTVDVVAKAGFAGIAVEAGHSLVVDLEGTTKAANRAGLFIFGLKPFS